MKREEFQPAGLPAPISHYCDAVRWGDLLFVSGVADRTRINPVRQRPLTSAASRRTAGCGRRRCRFRGT
jgi:enamine deaminase RidA (YjgF/YER057c/UK114 family)